MTEIYKLLNDINPSIVLEFHEKKCVKCDLKKELLQSCFGVSKCDIKFQPRPYSLVNSYWINFGPNERFFIITKFSVFSLDVSLYFVT